MGLIDLFKSYRSISKNGKENASEEEMSFLEHLEELRWHLVRSVAAIVICAIAVGINIRWVYDEVINWPLQSDFPIYQMIGGVEDLIGEGDSMDNTQQNYKPMGQLVGAILIAIVGGFLISFPYVLWEVWRFIKPGLYQSEKRAVRGNVFVISALFFTGIGFAYFIITPLSFRFLQAFTLSDNIQNIWHFTEIIDLEIRIIVAGGLTFQMPMLVYYLARMGLITHNGLRKFRRHAIVVLLVLSAILTPPDPITQVLIFLPLFGLYQISIRIAKRTTLKREKELANDPTANEEAAKAAATS